MHSTYENIEHLELNILTVQYGFHIKPFSTYIFEPAGLHSSFESHCYTHSTRIGYNKPLCCDRFDLIWMDKDALD